MNIANVYGKSLTFFSRSRQERIVSSIECDFYEAITIYTQDANNIERLRLKLEKTLHNISHHVIRHYFEDDLLEYLFNLLIFIMEYRETLQSKGPARPLGETSIRITK